MPYLVDGSNLGGVVGGAAGARDRPAVLGLLLPWARRRRVTVVFDGPPDPGLATSYGALELRFAVGRSADQLILGLLGRRPADWTVVSDDRDLLAACRGRGARVLLATELLARLAAGAGEIASAAVPAARAAPRREGPVDVADWEEWFRRGREGPED
jgi:hypothetical protein